MNIELIVTIGLAMISSLLPWVYKKITESNSIINLYILLAAFIVGIFSATVFYSLITFGLLTTLYFLIIYVTILGSIFITQYLVKLNSK